MEIETIMKAQRETALEIENLGKRSGASPTEYKRYKREFRSRRYHRKHQHDYQRLCKMEKAPSPKHIRNPGRNEKIKPKDNRYRRK